MSFCFQLFGYSSNINCCVNKHVNKSQPKKNSPLVSFPSLIIPQAAEGNDNLSVTSFPIKSLNSSSLVNNQPNAIGILGGASVDSTLQFAKKTVWISLEDEENGLPFVLCSDPALSKEILSLGSECTDPSLVVESLRLKRISLEKSGVCCVVMPCHISHTWHDEIKEGCSVPFLHMGECVAKELKEAKFRSREAGRHVRIGILSTNEALATRIYQEKLENEGFEVILPDKATIDHTLIPAVEALKRNDYEGAENLFRIALQFLLMRAVNRVILGSDELREFLPPNDSLWFKCIDPINALARAAVKYAQSAGRENCETILHD